MQAVITTNKDTLLFILYHIRQTSVPQACSVVSK